jgi:hypothetical protein
MLLGKLARGQLTGMVARNPLRAFFRAHSRPTLHRERFHGVSFSLTINVGKNAPRLPLTMEYDAPGDPYKPTAELIEKTVKFLS